MTTIERFIRYMEAERRYSPLTVRNYRRDIASLLAFLGCAPEEFDPAAVTGDDVRGWIVSLSEKQGLSAASINRAVSSIRSLFRYCRRIGAMRGDPLVKVSRLKTPTRLPVYVTGEKMERVAGESAAERTEDPMRSRDLLIVLLLYATGIRLAELVGIKLADFSDDYRRLLVRGKGDKERVVPVLEPVRRRIIDYLEQIKAQKICTGPQISLFLSHRGNPISRIEVYRVVRRVLAEAGVEGKRSPHVLRHTFATHLMDNGCDMREIQELLGHASLRATQVYTHNSVARLKAVYLTAHPRGDK